MAHTVELELAGRTLRLETGHMAKQADGSVLATYGDTYVLATAVASQTAKKDIDFLPLTVDYQEKAYAAGKIPGGYFKREGQPSEKEKLSSRLIDRPMRENRSGACRPKKLTRHCARPSRISLRRPFARPSLFRIRAPGRSSWTRSRPRP